MNNLTKAFAHQAAIIVNLRTLSSTKLFYKCVTSKEKWDYVVKNAERVVGYPTPFLSLHSILSGEISNVAPHIGKLKGSNHPLIKTAKNLLLDRERPTWGLIILLMSKLAGLNSNFSEIECDKTADVLHSQRMVAKIMEMIKTSNLIHKTIINFDHNTKYPSDLIFGNKLALLSGDYLLATSFHEIAQLKNFPVQECMFSTLKDLIEAEFIGLRNEQNEPIPSKPISKQEDISIPLDFGVEPFKINYVMGNMKAEWTVRNILGGGSLLAKCCHSVLTLAKHEAHVQQLGYSFGRNLALAWQASLDKEEVKKEKFSLIGAPVMFHLEYDPSFHEKITGGVDYDLIRKTVMSGPGLNKTIELKNEFSEVALGILKKFPNNESNTALVNIVKCL